MDINEVDIVRSGNGNSCGPGIGSGKFDGRTNNTGRSSLQSLQCGEVEGQKSLPDTDMAKTIKNAAPTNDHLVSILRDRSLNWFAFIAELKQLLENYPADVLEHMLLDFSECLPCSDLPDYENRTVKEITKHFIKGNKKI